MSSEVEKLESIEPSKAVEVFDDKDVEEAKPKRKKAKSVKVLDDKGIEDLIYKHEMAPWGLDKKFAKEAMANIREVRVDDIIGPNVQETLLRNLNKKMVVKSSSISLPKLENGSRNRLAKRKQHITHLAQVAVSRNEQEQLRDQWADNREKRISSAKRYGLR